MATVTGVAISLANLATGFVAIATTSTGVATVATGVNTYVATLPEDLAIGQYLVTWTGTDEDLESVQATEIISVVEGPANAYTTLTAVKGSLGKITNDDRDEAILASIVAASRMIDSETGRWPGAYAPSAVATSRTFNRQGRVWEVDARSWAFRVDDIAADSGILVEGGTAASGIWTALASYGTGPDNAISYGQPVSYLTMAPSFFGGIDSIRVTAKWGWPETPAEIELATRLQAARLYRRKDSPQGVIAIPEFGGIRVSRFDPDVRALLAPFMIPGFA
jgi:hypothetical protein